jgi:uncharacterized membrane protein
MRQLDLESSGGNGVTEKKKRNSKSYKTLLKEERALSNRLFNRLMIVTLISGLLAVALILTVAITIIK